MGENIEKEFTAITVTNLSFSSSELLTGEKLYYAKTKSTEIVVCNEIPLGKNSFGHKIYAKVLTSRVDIHPSDKGSDWNCLLPKDAFGEGWYALTYIMRNENNVSEGVPKGRVARHFQSSSEREIFLRESLLLQISEFGKDFEIDPSLKSLQEEPLLTGTTPQKP